MKCWFLIKDMLGKYVSTRKEFYDVTGYEPTADIDSLEFNSDGADRYAKYIQSGEFYKSSIITKMRYADGSYHILRTYVGIIDNEKIILSVELPKIHSLFYKIRKSINSNSIVDFRYDYAVSKHELSGEFLGVSGEFNQLIGVPMKYLAATDVYKLAIHPNDRARVFKESHVHVHDKISEVVYRLKTASGKYIWVKTYSTLINDKIYAVTVKLHIIPTMLTFFLNKPFREAMFKEKLNFNNYIKFK